MSLFAQNIPIGTDVLLRYGDATVTTQEQCTSKNMSWETNTPSGSACLNPCPSGYNSSWDRFHGAVCMRIDMSGAQPPTNAPPTTSTAEEEARRKLYEQQTTQTDVFQRDAPPAPPSSVLLDLGNGIQLDTNGVLLLIGLFYLIYTRKT
jgi:hypothetical protein